VSSQSSAWSSRQRAHSALIILQRVALQLLDEIAHFLTRAHFRLSRVQLPDSKEIARSDRSNVIRVEGDDRLRMARGGNKLDLNGGGRVDMYNRANIPALQPVTWQISCNDYRVESLEGHSYSCGYAVTNRGVTAPASIIQTVRCPSTTNPSW
jgi:hypothetical protein